MKKILLAFVLLGFALTATQLAHAQGAAAGNPVVVNGVGQPMAGVTVAICNANPGPNPTSLCSGAALVPLFTDVTLTTPCTGTLTALNNQYAPSVGAGCSNPGLTDGLGNVIAFANVGAYWCEYTGSNIVGIAVAFCQFPGVGSGGGGGTVNGATLNQGLQLAGAGTTLGLVPCTITGQVLQYNLAGTVWQCASLGTVNAGTISQVGLYSATGNAISGDANLTDSGTMLSYLDIFRTAYFGPIGTGPAQANNICLVDGVTNANIQACQDKAENYPTNNGVRSVITFSNIPEDITVDPVPPNLSLELYLGTGYHSTSFGTPPSVNTWTIEAPIILSQGSFIRGTGKVTAGGDLSGGTVLTNGPNFPPPLGVPTVSNPTCGSAVGGSLSNGTYYIQIRTANNLESHPGKLAVMGPSMTTGEISVTCSGGGSTQQITGAAPSAVGNSPFQAQDYQLFASTTSGAEQLQYSSATGSPTPLSCTAGVVSTFNGNNWGCKMTAGFTLNSIQAGTRSPELTDNSNPLFVFTPSQTVGFNVSLQNLSIICQNGTTAQTDSPNVAIWNLSGEEFTNLPGVEISNCGGGYGAGAGGTTGGSATAFPGTAFYGDTHTSNSSLSGFNVAGGPPNTLSAAGTYYSIILDGNADTSGVASGVAGIISDITITPKVSGASVPAAILVTGIRARVNFASRVHIETTNPAGADGIQCTNGAYCEFHGVEAQVSTTGNMIDCTATVGACVGEGGCPIGTAGSGQARCAGQGGMKTFKDGTNGTTYTGYLANLATSTSNSVFGNVTVQGTCTGCGGGGGPSIDTNGTANASQSILSFRTSTTNAVGLTVTPTYAATGHELFEITGGSYTGNAATATALATLPTPCTTGFAPTGILANGNSTGCAPTGGFPTVVYSTASPSVTSGISATTMATAGASGDVYRMSAYVTITAGGTSCSASPTSFAIDLIFTDPNGSGTTTLNITDGTLQLVASGNGAPGYPSFGPNLMFTYTFAAKASTPAQYSTSYTAASGCSPGPAYRVYPVLEVLQ